MEHSLAPAYDTALAAAVWQRVSPALPAFPGTGPAAEGLRPLLQQGTDTETALGCLVEKGAQLCMAGRRCGQGAPRNVRAALFRLAQEQQQTLRTLLAAHYLFTGRWRQPSRPTPVEEPWLAAVRRVFLLETALERDCRSLARDTEETGFGRLLTAQAEAAAHRAQRLAALLENTLTTGDPLLKW